MLRLSLCFLWDNVFYSLAHFWLTTSLAHLKSVVNHWPFFFSFCSTLSQCCHAVVALLYPFTWQHTYIPVLPPSMLDIVCTPTPFIVGLLSSSLPRLKELPIEEVRWVHYAPMDLLWTIAPGNDIALLCSSLRSWWSTSATAASYDR